jgi:hypothetical protein
MDIKIEYTGTRKFESSQIGRSVICLINNDEIQCLCWVYYTASAPIASHRDPSIASSKFGSSGSASISGN